MSEYTKGPWTADIDVVRAENAGLTIAEIDGYTVDEQVANSALIAAAPDLLAACERMLRHFTETNPDQLDALAQTAEAITKAKGETK